MSASPRPKVEEKKLSGSDGLRELMVGRGFSKLHKKPEGGANLGGWDPYKTNPTKQDLPTDGENLDSCGRIEQELV